MLQKITSLELVIKHQKKLHVQKLIRNKIASYFPIIIHYLIYSNRAYDEIISFNELNIQDILKYWKIYFIASSFIFTAEHFNILNGYHLNYEVILIHNSWS